jgi:light-regulated signal transduction histidine kinase (bacteriophytochrome)
VWSKEFINHSHSILSARPRMGVIGIVDLSECDSEPIHIPGATQPHGILFGLSRGELRIEAVSENVADHVGQDARGLLGRPFAALLDGSCRDALTEAASMALGDSVRLAPIKLGFASSPPMRTLIHSGPEGLLLEAEQPSQHAELAPSDLFARFDAASSRLLTGYDRVKIYRFAPDWSGEVIAEDGNGVLPSYMGLHFPASDIPPQARTLYTRNLERQIPDIGYTPVKLLQTSPEPLDLSLIGLRTVSPNHIAYLQDMGVGASMSISILRQGALWGLVACHHHSAYYVPPELRQASVLLAQLAAWQLTVVEEAEIVRRSVDVKAIEADLLRATSNGQDYREGLQRNSAALLGLLQAGGLVLSGHGGAVFTMGEVPETTALTPLLRWLAARGPDMFETDHLASHYPPGAHLPEAAGVLAVPLDGSPDNVMVWFRPELRRTVTWSGDPDQGAQILAGSDRPHRSFAAWTEEVRLRSRPWEPHELAAASGLRDMIVDVIARRAAELERLNAVLKQKNEDLEAFAYVAAHDLREPLRQIQTFGTLLERAFRRAANPAENVDRWFEGIQTSAQRLRLLINDLAEYSRVGRDAKPLVPVALNQLLDKVLVDFAQPIEDFSARIEADKLPTVLCDPTQMRQVVQNLISNALKYRSPDRAPVIRIKVDTDEADPPDGLTIKDGPVVKLAFADNGIGFEEVSQHRIFEPFERLHSNDIYEGSGLGLAICRKIIDRHGGAISAESRLGEGSVFRITLPVRPLPAPGAP